MPEGDTIRRLADSLSARFAGSTVISSLFRHPRLATCDLAGMQLTHADAYGKHLLMRFSGNVTLHVHLRMDGAVYQRRVDRTPAFKRHFQIEFDRGHVTGVDVPIVELLKSRDEQLVTSHLGPDVCGHYDHDGACTRLAGAGDTPISQALLDQRIIAGLGNIYAVETPFLVGVNPMAPVNSLSNTDGLLSVAVGLIRTNARFGPQNTTGRRLRSSDHWVLTRDKFQCRVCGARLQRLSGKQTPWQRRTAWCPVCQPVEKTDVDLARAAKLLALHPCRRIVDLETGELTANTKEVVKTQSLSVNEGGRHQMK